MADNVRPSTRTSSNAGDPNDRYSRMANYASGIGITAILVGLASVALKRRFGNQIVINISWALFIAMLLHAPSWL